MATTAFTLGANGGMNAAAVIFDSSLQGKNTIENVSKSLGGSSQLTISGTTITARAYYTPSTNYSVSQTTRIGNAFIGKGQAIVLESTISLPNAGSRRFAFELHDATSNTDTTITTSTGSFTYYIPNDGHTKEIRFSSYNEGLGGGTGYQTLTCTINSMFIVKT